MLPRALYLSYRKIVSSCRLPMQDNYKRFEVFREITVKM
jgi:hypothetical protein